jgi:hypothetical protein
VQGVISPAAAEAAPSLSAQTGRATALPPKKLDDDSMLKFIQDGYVLLHPDLPSDVSRLEDTAISYNEMICDKVNNLQEQGRDTGNNLLPQLPELMTLFDHPTIHGALQSILGDDYYIHLHHATHTKRGIEDGLGQRHHKDSVGIHLQRNFSGFFHTKNTVSWVQPQALARDDIAGWRMYQAIHAIAWTQNAATTAPAG